MEYNVLNSNELVFPSPPRYLSESIPQKTNVVLLPFPYQGVGAPEAQYQSLHQGPYQNLHQAPYQSFQDTPFQTLPAPSYQTLQSRTLQAHNFLEVPYQSFQGPSWSLQPSHQAQSLPEIPYPSLQGPSHSTFQAQSLPAPVHQSTEDIFSANNTLTSTTAFAGSEILSGQDMRDSEEGFDIDVAAPAPEATEGSVVDTSTLIETPPGTVRRSCTNCCSSMKDFSSFCRRSIDELSSSYRNSIDEIFSSYRESIEELSSSQKRSSEKVDNIGRAWSRFAEDVASDIDENRLWRISIEEKIEQLLDERNGSEHHDYAETGN